MNSVEDDVGLDYKLYIQRSKTDFISANDPKRNSVHKIEKISFGKTIVDRLDYHYEQKTVQYFKIVGESQKFTYNNKIFTTKHQNHYLWKSNDSNIYNSQIKELVTNSVSDVSDYDEHANQMIGTLELNFVPDYKSDDFDIVKMLIPIFKTSRLNKNGLELINCIRTASDVAIPTKNIDMGNFIPTNTPYLINKFGIKSKDSTDYDRSVGVIIFTSSNIHLDDNILQPHFFNVLDIFDEINIGYLEGDDVSEEDPILWSEKGIRLVTEEKNCREVHYEGETLAHSTNKLSGTTIKNMPFEERIGQLMKSPLGLQVVIFITFTLLLFVYKLAMGGLVSTIGEAGETKSNRFLSMTKAGSQSSVGAWILFGIIFAAFFILMKEDWLPN